MSTRWRPITVVVVGSTVALLGCRSGGSAAPDSVSPDSVPPESVSPESSLTAPQPSAPTTSDATAPEGFQAVVIEVTRPDGTTESYCVWLAETVAQREQGLMNVTSLGGADGMLFRFGADQNTSFWMKDTLLPLSIAFVGGDGGFVSSTDMEPCAPDVAACPVYGADAPYTDALEVPKGELGALGIGPGARLTVTGAACAPSG